MYSGKKIVTVAVLAACAALAFAGGKKEAPAGGAAPAPAAAAPASPTSLPRNETLYVGGLLWGAPQNFSPFATAGTFPVTYNNAVFLVYEPLFMYNQLSNQSEPLLGKSFEWTDATTLKVTLQKGTKFNDGSPLTSEDVVYTYMLAKTNPTPWSSYMSYIDEVVAQGPETVLIKMNKNRQNRLYILDSLNHVWIIPKAHWTGFLAKNNNDFTKALNEFNANPIGSGPYKVIFYDETRVVAQRNDDYWGKSVFGKLPAPKYIAHLIYKSNDAASNAFRQGEIDVNQQFMPKVWTLWEGQKEKLYKTYLPEAPYYIPAMIPSLVINMTRKGLGTIPELRRALAMSIDYKKIADVAMSGYSDKMVPALILQVPSEKALVDESKLASLRYTMDVDAANKLLDSIGAKPGADGIRVMPDGMRLGPWDVMCPYGWSDWNASLEIVVQSAKKIGVELRTKFPEQPVWNTDTRTGNFDITMFNTPAASISMPWERMRAFMDSSDIKPLGEPVAASNNFGRYKNERADAIIKAIPAENDPAKVKALYTELNQIYLTDLPQIGLMYRPGAFYTVYEGVWKGFPDVNNNPNNIPPAPFREAFTKVIYHLTPAK
jgi:peptide/nickel transport system substrate-binding protein